MAENGMSSLDSLTTKDRKLCIETLLKIFRNIKTHPDDSKYRTLKLSNKRFLDEVWRHEGAREFMVACGWMEVDETVSLFGDADVSAAITRLLANRNVKPAASEWTEANKITGETRKRLREEELKTKALIAKEKEIAQLKKDKIERKAIARRIMHEHRHDHQIRVAGPSIAVPRGDGASAKMTDITPKGG